MNHETPDIQDGFKKGRGTRDQIANIHWIIEKAGESQKNICFIGYTKAFVWIMTNWAKFLEMGVLAHLTCLLRNMRQQLESDMEQQTVPNWERSISRLYIVTQLI